MFFILDQMMGYAKLSNNNCKLQNNVGEKLKHDVRGVENIVGKKKMLVTSIFAFSYNVFKRLFPQGRFKSSAA